MLLEEYGWPDDFQRERWHEEQERLWKEASDEMMRKYEERLERQKLSQRPK